MIVPRFVVRGVSAISARFVRKAAVLPVQTDEVVEINAQRLLQRIRARASGRPGPRVITGRYRASWHVQRTGRGQRMVTTGEPQAARLEYGFAGVDSLGRTYNQPPFPHMNPAANEIENTFVNDMAVMVTDGL